MVFVRLFIYFSAGDRKNDRNVAEVENVVGLQYAFYTDQLKNVIAMEPVW